MKKLNTAIIGYGKSGYGIHGMFYKSELNNMIDVKAVVELDSERREVAKNDWGCDVYEDYTAIFARDDIDLVVNASFSHMHYPITLDLLKHGFNVLCEKPFCETAEQAQEMIDAARENNVTVTVFQQSRLAPYFIKMREVIESGVLGDIFEIRASFSGFSRRYDWQTVQSYNAGSMRNTGPHPFDQVLYLLDIDDMPEVYAKLGNYNSYGDADDYVKAIITYPGKPLFQIDINPSECYGDYIYKVYGTHGCFKCTAASYEYKYYVPEEVPELSLTLEPVRDENGTPAYCNSRLTFHEVSGEIAGSAFDSAVASYYKLLYAHLVNGDELFVKPEKIKQQIAVFEEISKKNPLPKKY
jgi:scyllo-inositol 2-dehydrogenase (NADP+)